MEDESAISAVWRAWRAPEPNLALRVSLSLVTGCLLLAGSILAAWAYAHLVTEGRIRDSHIGIALLLAGLVWLVTLVVIWRPMRRGRAFILPALGTLAIAVGVISGGVLIDEMLRVRDEELLIFALVLIGGAAIILIWLPTVIRVLQGRPVVGADNLVRVHCPQCGYSLIELRQLRCPECGQEFTIDDLIRAQNYSGVPRVSTNEAQPSNVPRLRAVNEEPAARPQRDSHEG
ncbi:MAG: hypothetical protein ABIG44_15050 [Planctomycetota bacterium]